MLNKLNRLQKDKDFSKVFRSSRPVFTGNLNVRALKRPDAGPSRFGFVISNKIEKRATRRNALKRRLRAATRELIPSIKVGFNVVITVKQNYSYPYDYVKLKTDLNLAYAKIGLKK
ncbi:ribonuclease P protein component [Candidatus Berkelbacteria bacterium CG10_big_fil_rev_8_21_14_0_10_43_13]|uniref:Ribonuclease P protein component n=1 Tax=Candidatus Berkelbacteria bacterium CG10_big_fil_rev_8_21_14_0_10_43_13 TaxID=1974514 RepID=A0A2H0W7M6_9BACT|nr:MAG: ribonuclease P protein component [Candidatus Berkelbacteria bacterium CG10_big_fil_rev_8_21_14_0_10_43_13]